MKTNLITLAMLAVALALLGTHAREVAWTPVKIAGAVLAAVSVVLLVVARLQLGASFAVQAKAHKLVTTGLYAKIRNPIYVFAALFLVGLAMVSGRWIFLLAIAVLAPLQMVRARKEEQVLSDAFGEEYARWKAQTWF
jgi:protein-S-isoprenylcysteine O-methyltransferase Ste14